MNLRSFEGKMVRILDTDGQTFEGMVGDYIFPEDNEPEGEDGVVIDNPKYPNLIEFRNSEIRDIRVIKELSN